MINAETARNLSINSKDVEAAKVNKFMRRYYNKILKKTLKAIEHGIVNTTNKSKYNYSYAIMKCGIIDPFSIKDLLDKKLKNVPSVSLQIEIERAIANALLRDIPRQMKATGFDVYAVIHDGDGNSITSITEDDKYVYARIDIKWGSDESVEKKK